MIFKFVSFLFLHFLTHQLSIRLIFNEFKYFYISKTGASVYLNNYQKLSNPYPFLQVYNLTHSWKPKQWATCRQPGGINVMLSGITKGWWAYMRIMTWGQVSTHRDPSNGTILTFHAVGAIPKTWRLYSLQLLLRIQAQYVKCLDCLNEYCLQFA